MCVCVRECVYVYACVRACVLACVRACVRMFQYGSFRVNVTNAYGFHLSNLCEHIGSINAFDNLSKNPRYERSRLSYVQITAI